MWTSQKNKKLFAHNFFIYIKFYTLTTQNSFNKIQKIYTSIFTISTTKIRLSLKNEQHDPCFGEVLIRLLSLNNR